jgi:hypothetical protein
MKIFSNNSPPDSLPNSNFYLPTSIMASNGNENLQRTTRRVARIDYEVLNGGPDSPDGGLPSDQLTESDISRFFDPDPPSTDQDSLVFSDILPHESASQTFTRKIKRARPSPTTDWIWNYFSTTEVSHEWKARSGGRKTRDRGIYYIVIDDKGLPYAN